MSLNSVVNKLVRAAASVPQDISDTDLDAHVARLLAAEAKSNDAKWAELGLGAYLKNDTGRDSPDPSQPKPNKRFLASVIRTVDGHNQALLRSQAQAASEARDARIDSRRERTAGGASRLFGGALASMGRDSRPSARSARDSGRDSERDSGRDSGRNSGRESERGTPLRDRMSGRERDRDISDREASSSYRRDSSPRRERERSPRSSRKHDRKRDYDSDSDAADRKHRSRRRYSSSEDDDRKSKSRNRDRDRDCDRDDRRSRYDSDDERQRRKDKGRRRDRSASREREKRKESRRKDREDDGDRRRRRDRDRSISPKRSAPPPPPDSPPRPPSDRISRMDKYFTKSYDPRFDVGDVPATGPVTDVGWDGMLAILKERGKKRRRNSPTLSDSPEPQKKDRTARPPTVAPAPAMSADMKTLMEMEYTRKGGVREWDKGKET